MLFNLLQTNGSKHKTTWFLKQPLAAICPEEKG
jgi:hypothetical protein